MAQLVALMSGVVLGGVAEVVGSNLARGKIFTASIGSVDSLYPSVYIYIYIYIKLSNKNSILVFVLRVWYHRSCVWLQRRNNVMVTSIYTLETAVNYT